MTLQQSTTITVTTLLHSRSKVMTFILLYNIIWIPMSKLRKILVHLITLEIYKIKSLSKSFLICFAIDSCNKHFLRLSRFTVACSEEWFHFIFCDASLYANLCKCLNDLWNHQLWQNFSTLHLYNNPSSNYVYFNPFLRLFLFFVVNKFARR